MKKGKVTGEIKLDSNKTVRVNVSLYTFTEDGSEIVYCPALDLYGYGNTIQEAEHMFSYTLSSFFKYTTNKKTLFKLLNQLGWEKVEKSKKSLIPPDLDKLLVDREGFRSLLESGRVKIIKDSPIEIPEFA